MAEIVEGYVVKSWGGRFLSRGFNRVKHRLGVDMAWVHTLKSLQENRHNEEFNDVEEFIPATFDPASGAVVVTGKAIEKRDFARLLAGE